MPLNQNIRVCTHIKVNGVPCGSPALHGEIFCYFHQRMIRGVPTPPKSRSWMEPKISTTRWML